MFSPRTAVAVQVTRVISGRCGGSCLTACALTSVFRQRSGAPCPDVRFSHPAVTAPRHNAASVSPPPVRVRGGGVLHWAPPLALARTAVLSGGGGGLWLSGVLRSGTRKYRSRRFFQLFSLNFCRFVPTWVATFALFAVTANGASAEISQTTFYTEGCGISAMNTQIWVLRMSQNPGLKMFYSL